ncbi:structural basis of auto-inhibitory mechanism of histone methyltransferase, partial [Cladochytrium replicatum]
LTVVLEDIYIDRKPRKAVEIATCHCRPQPSEPACGDNCLNRMMYIECTPEHCPCGPKCTNQRFQRKEERTGLEVFWTSVRGFGVRTTTPIPKGSFVIEYRGEIVSQETCAERMRTIYKGLENHYFLDYAAGLVIDGCRKGTNARFVNHGCEPNCHIEKWYVNGEFCVGIFASVDIAPGTELSYDYRFESFGPMQQCHCGSKKCRGTVHSCIDCFQPTNNWIPRIHQKGRETRSGRRCQL